MPIGTSISGIAGANATKDAAEQSAMAIYAALKLQKEMYDKDIARQEPFYNQGIESLDDYLKMLRGGYDMKESPAAQYELQQGTKALNRQMAARGILGGGTAANRLGELSAGIGARDWQNQYARLVEQLMETKQDRVLTNSAISLCNKGTTWQVSTKT
jgi:glutamine cyclotransferase